MPEQPMLSEKEWGLVLELLRVEADELPAELHHTDSPQVAEELEERKKMVNNLIQRLQNRPLQ